MKAISKQKIEINLAAYEKLRKQASKAATVSAELYVPKLYKLLRDAGHEPDKARAQLEEDCPFWSARWIREYLPEEALHTEKRNIAKAHAEDKANRQAEFDAMDEEGDDTEFHRNDEYSSANLDKQNAIVFEGDEKGIISKKHIEFNPNEFNLVVMTRDEYTSILRGLDKNMPELDELAIGSITFEINGVKVIGTEIHR